MTSFAITAFTLTWISAIAFSGFVIWGSNVPTGKRTPAVIWITSFLVLFQIVTQSYLFRVDVSSTASIETRHAAELAMKNFQVFLDALALQPGKLLYYPASGWYRIASSSLLHYGWLHLLCNIWFFVLFGHVLEHAIGTRRFIAIVAAGLIVPPILDGLVPLFQAAGANTHDGGFSGVVYAVMGAYIVLFPKSRCYGAVNYDLRFWGAILCILLPVTMVTRFAGLALTETVLIMGIAAAFLLLQPEHARVSAPIAIIALYKLLQDVLLIQPSIHDVISNTFWRVIGGFAIGVGSGLYLNGLRGLKMTWNDDTLESSPKHNTRTRMSVAKLEAEGHKSADGARIFLGQRVFVGDAERSIAFYRDIVIPKYPDLLLPLQEQIALARLLQFKGYEKESLHAYETLVRGNPMLPDEYWVAWLKAAELTLKMDPENTAGARKYLDQFEQGNIIMMRDKVEAQRLRALLPVVEEETPFATHKELEQSNEAPGTDIGPYTHSFKRVRAKPLPRGNPEPVEDEPATADDAIPKSRPKTFLYVPGSSPVSLRQQHNRPVAITLADPEFLRAHWKPLPSLAENNPKVLMTLDSRVKNPRLADEENTPSMYAGAKQRTDRDTRSRNRLSHLEFIRNLPVPAAAPSEMPARYGGLDETEAGAVQIRLRSEPANAPNDLQHRWRVNRRKEPTDTHWTERLEPVSINPVPESGYGEIIADTNGIQSISKETALAVMLVGSYPEEDIHALKQMHPQLVEQFGMPDYSEICSTSICPIFLFRRLPEAEREKLQQSADNCGLRIRFVPESDPMLNIEPIEVVGIVVNATGCILKTMFGSRRIAWDELVMISMCRTRLTLNSRSLHRILLEFVVHGKDISRYQLFERTLSVKSSGIDGQTFENTELLLTAAWKYAFSIASRAAHYPEEQDSLQLPQFDSYSLYNEEILRRLLTTT